MNEQAPVRPASWVTRNEGSAAVFGAALAVTAWGSASILIKHVDMDGLAIASYRFALYALVLALWMRARGTPVTFRVLRHSLLGGLALGLDVALFFSAVKLTTIANATVIGALQPVVVTVVAVRFFGETVRARDIAWSALAITATVAVVLGSTGAPQWDIRGDILAIGAVFAWSGYFIFSKRSRDVISSTEYTVGTGLITTATTVPLALIIGQDLSWPSSINWFWLIVMAMSAGILGHSLMNWSIVRAPLWLASTFTLLIPVVSSTLAWIILDEALNALQIGAMAVVLGSLAMLVTGQGGAS